MKKVIVFTISLILLVSRITQAQDDNFKALFMYNVCNFIDWPAVEEKFIIHVLGNTTIIEIFSTDPKLKDKTYSQLPIILQKVDAVAGIGNCQILYISETKASDIDAAVAAIGTKPTLIVTHADGAIAKGSCINFIKEASGKLTMEISRRNIEKHGLKVDGKLLLLGKEVNN